MCVNVRGPAQVGWPGPCRLDNRSRYQPASHVHHAATTPGLDEPVDRRQVSPNVFWEKARVGDILLEAAPRAGCDAPTRFPLEATYLRFDLVRVKDIICVEVLDILATRMPERRIESFRLSRVRLR